MRCSRRVIGALAGCLLSAGLLAPAGQAAAAGVAQDRTPVTVPSATTPHVLDTAERGVERVLEMAEVGSRIVVAGEFDQVRDVATDSAVLTRRHVFSFDAATGAVDRAFAPVVNGIVRTVAAGPNDTVFLGGTFSTVNGTTIRNLAQVSLTTGALTSFRPAAINGAVNDVLWSSGRLWVGGFFNSVGAQAHSGLATLNPSSGQVDPYMGVDVSENHNWPEGTARAPVGVVKLDVAPDGGRLVAIGNFQRADGLIRDQVVQILLGPTAASVDPNWRTRGYEAACLLNAYDFYVRDVQFSPDGSYFAIATTGGQISGSLCDTLARWETTDTGDDVRPRWANFTGGDTLYSVAISGTAVYAGGHQRWLNNPAGKDRARQGAVPRPGLAAVDPRTGVPLAWNPGRHPRGIGAEALLLTSRGLYVGSDTEFIGKTQYKRPRLAFFSLQGAAAMPSESRAELPATVYLAGRTVTTDADVVRSWTYDGGTTTGAVQTSSTSGTQWGKARGAFMAGNMLFYGYPASDGKYYLHRRTFDGTAFGAPSVIDPYNDPFWSDVPSGSTTSTGEIIYYRGALPAFYGQLSSVSGMFYADGRLYYSRTGTNALFYRGFSVDSGIVSAAEFVAASTGFGDVAGMFLSGDQLYYATASSGELRRVAFVAGAPSGATATAAPGPAAGGHDWRTRAMFLGPAGPAGPANAAPTAAFTSSCVELTCSFDGRGSSDSDGTITSYAWAFGDGTTGTGPTTSRTYGSAGPRTVRLTVTDDDGATHVVERTVDVPGTSVAEPISSRAAAGATARRVTSVQVTVPAAVQAGDGLVVVVSTNSGVTATLPAGWTQELSQASGTNMTTQVFSKVATTGDAGTAVVATLNGTAATAMQLSAYDGTSTTDPVSTVAGRFDTGGTSHTTPLVDAPAGSWLLSVWADKQLDPRTWTPPASGVVVRDSRAGLGNGDIAALLADSGAPVSGSVGGLTATVPTASGRASVLSIVLAAGG